MSFRVVMDDDGRDGDVASKRSCCNLKKLEYDIIRSEAVKSEMDTNVNVILIVLN